MTSIFGEYFTGHIDSDDYAIHVIIKIDNNISIESVQFVNSPEVDPYYIVCDGNNETEWGHLDDATCHFDKLIARCIPKGDIYV